MGGGARFALLLYFAWWLIKAVCLTQRLFLKSVKNGTASADVGGTFHTGF